MNSYKKLLLLAIALSWLVGLVGQAALAASNEGLMRHSQTGVSAADIAETNKAYVVKPNSLDNHRGIGRGYLGDGQQQRV